MEICCCAVVCDFLFRLKIITKIIINDLRTEKLSVNAILLVAVIGVVTTVKDLFSVTTGVVAACITLLIFWCYRYIPIYKAIEIYAETDIDRVFSGNSSTETPRSDSLFSLLSPSFILRIEGQETPRLKVFGERVPSMKRQEIPPQEIRGLYPDRRKTRLLDQGSKKVVYANLCFKMDEFCTQCRHDIKLAETARENGSLN